MNISLSSSSLKIIAYSAMIVDHVGLLFFPEQIIWRIIGRIAFPLFAFLIAEGYRHSSNVKKYATRLFFFALISQIPFIMFYYSVGMDTIPLNIFFTLFAGLVATAVVARLPRRYAVLSVIAICLVAELLNFEFGAYGVLTILGSYLFLVQKKLGAITLVFLPFLKTLVSAMAGLFFVQFAATISVPFISVYNGKRGLVLPYHLFYWFYPLHLLALCFILKLLF